MVLLHPVASLTSPLPQEGLHPQPEAAGAQHLETPHCAIISSLKQKTAVLCEFSALYELGEGARKEREKASHVFWSTTKTPAGRAIGIPTLHMRKLRPANVRNLSIVTQS